MNLDLTIADLAKKYLRVQASSAGPERMFRESYFYMKIKFNNCKILMIFKRMGSEFVGTWHFSNFLIPIPIRSKYFLTNSHSDSNSNS
jgi:hypothetical protein